MVGCSVLPSLAAGIFSFCWGAPHPFQTSPVPSEHSKMPSPSQSTLPSVTSLCTCTQHNIEKRKHPLKKRANQAIKRNEQCPCRTEGRYLYNCRSLCVYLTHSHLSCTTAEKEASLPLQETTAALAIVALPLSSAQRREEAVRKRAKSDATNGGTRHP